MLFQRTTGLIATQFATLITALTHQLIWVKPAEKPRKLTPAQALKITLISHRHKLTQEALARLFSVSQPTISRIISTIEKALTQVPKPLNSPLGESLKAPGSLVIDGTLLPTWNCRSQGKTNFSGKHKHAGFNHQVICTLDGMDPGYLARALEAGASGFVVKDTPAAQLAETIRKVYAGLRVVDPALATEAFVTGTSPLTDRERDVLIAAKDGASIMMIASQLHLSQGTVRNHLSNAIAKLNAENRFDAAHQAEANGWL